MIARSGLLGLAGLVSPVGLSPCHPDEGGVFCLPCCVWAMTGPGTGKIPPASRFPFCAVLRVGNGCRRGKISERHLVCETSSVRHLISSQPEIGIDVFSLIGPASFSGLPPCDESNETRTDSRGIFRRQSLRHIFAVRWYMRADSVHV
jgi:hypothetical protein